MSSRKREIKALYQAEDGLDNNQYLLLSVFVTQDNQLDVNKPITGSAYEWNDAKERYVSYDFELNSIKEGKIEIKWDEYSSPSTIDILGISIEHGAIFTRIDPDEGTSSYKIINVYEISLLDQVKNKIPFLNSLVSTLLGLFSHLFLYLAMALVIIGMISILGFAIQYLWNNLIPEIFGLKEISFFQALGLFSLSYLLFGIPFSFNKKEKE